MLESSLLHSIFIFIITIIVIINIRLWLFFVHLLLVLGFFCFTFHIYKINLTCLLEGKAQNNKIKPLFYFHLPDDGQNK